MDVPPVQYTITTDGVSIAWAEAGQGPALLYCPPTPFSHVLEFVAVFEAYCAALARSFRLIIFDARGTGMSERDVADVSTATLLMDAEAVVDAAKLDRFAVFADTGHLALSMALQLAAALPERVTHLVLESPYQNMGELADTPYGRTGLALAEADWAVYTQTVIRVLSGWDPNDSTWVDPLAQAVAGWVDPSVGLHYMRVRDATDVGDLLAGVRQPTLVLRNEPNAVPARYCQRIAARIPGAQFRQFSDPTYEQTAELIRAFVGLPSSSLTLGTPDVSSALRAVLFTDLVGHTEMMQRLGDNKGRAVLREHERITRETLKEYGGVEVKTDGDSFMASFASVSAAVECAVSLQRGFARHSETADEPIVVRIGLNIGEPIEEDGDFFGSAVILGARIKDQAGGGEILVPEAVRHMLSGKSFLFSDRGNVALKGFEDPVRLYEVRWRGDAV
jgi:class 3 adenylate cyclase